MQTDQIKDMKNSNIQIHDLQIMLYINISCLSKLALSLHCTNYKMKLGKNGAGSNAKRVTL
jgi:hypothetical protein